MVTGRGPAASPASRRPDALLGWMESLADATRLRLLRLVERHELGVAELCDVLQLPQSTVSRHLKVLSDQGWVRARAQGTTNRYRMELEAAEAGARRLWALAREQMDGWATVEQDRLRLERVLARRPAAGDFFTGKASQWDRLREELYGRSFTTESFLGLLPPDWVVADLGCGTGQAAAALAAHVRRVVAVDQSAAMLKAARRRTAGFDNVELRQGSLEALPIEAGACAAALMLLTLTYVEDPAAALAEATRVLRPGGRLVVADLLRHDREDFRRDMGQLRAGFDTGEMAVLLEAIGLEGIQVRPLPPDPGAKGPALMMATATRRPKLIAVRSEGDKR
ncbi:MAG TPA: metalloregulator ArsR/SmtB family transcription factor [Vicinamibacteria bacterium]|nr:metalloregulator ArsR/SmtB family transcription factor [Vicinamibacteria bacterium]